MDFMTQQQTQVNTLAKDLIEDQNVCVRNIQNMNMNVNQLIISLDTVDDTIESINSNKRPY